MKTDSPPHYFKLARKYARKSNFNRVHLGCVAVYKNSVLAYGRNFHKSSPMQAHYNQFRNFDNMENAIHSVHSEINCINKIKYLDIDFSKLHIYVYREKQDGSLGMSRPCPACFEAIKQMGIKHIHYTTDDGFCYEKII